MQKHYLWAVLAVSLTLNLLLVPLIANQYLSFAYTQTLATWRTHVLHPNTVFLGDSITAGGRSFHHWEDINLGSGGLQTYQIAANMQKAVKLVPAHIVVMAGVNDAIKGPVDLAEMRKLWPTICRDSRVIVTLSPPTTDPTINQRLEDIAGVVRESCSSRKILSLDALRDTNGLIQPRFTVDGVHLTPAAYRIWLSALAPLGI